MKTSDEGKCRPGILLFLKAPVLGKVKTRLAKEVGESEALRAYCLSVERIIHNLDDSFPLLIQYTGADDSGVFQTWLKGPHLIYEAQCSGGLGDRLSHAFQSFFEKGYGPLFALGGY